MQTSKIENFRMLSNLRFDTTNTSYLYALFFAVTKFSLVKAKSNNADQDVIQEIENIPTDKFNSPVDTSKAFGQSH